MDNLSKDNLIKLSIKYGLTYKGKSRHNMIKLIYSIRSSYLPKKLLHEIEDFLKIPLKKDIQVLDMHYLNK